MMVSEQEGVLYLSKFCQDRFLFLFRLVDSLYMYKVDNQDVIFDCDQASSCPVGSPVCREAVSTITCTVMIEYQQ